MAQHASKGPTTVSVLGLGYMGTAIAKAFLKAGHTVSVWNRSPPKAQALLSLGARAPATAEACIQASEIVVTVFTGNDAFEAVFRTLNPAVGSGRILVNFGTGSPSQVRRCVDATRRHGFAVYVHAAMLSLPSGVGQSTTMALYSGPADALKRINDVVVALGRSVHLQSEDAAAAAVQEVVLSTGYYMVSAGYVQSMALLKKSGMWSPGKAEQFTKDFVLPTLHDTVESLVDLARQIDQGHFLSDEQGCRLENHAASLRKFVQTYQELNVATFGLDAFARVMEERIAQGGGDEEMSSLPDLL